MPGHGASDGPSDLSVWPLAVASALDFAVASGAESLFAAGEGAGAVAVLAAAATRTEVRAVVLASPEADDRIATFDDLRDARLPKLILVGSDSDAARERAEIFFRGAIGPCELVQFPVADQGSALFTGDWGAHAREKVLAHLLRFD
jgi:pimeloyl-ACP methyl ester carboxylesterase